MASSSSVILRSKYDVFLSFRGEDTRYNITAHLYAALCRQKIAAFIDDDGLKRGDEISPALLEAIEESKISVIIFSKDYASSRWCLDELAKIIECRKKKGQMVVPVFYHVSPSDIRKQTGSFEDAFRKHDERFKEMPERVRRWRAALTEAADLSGYDLSVIRSEYELVEEIVRDLLEKLTNISPLSDSYDGLVGIDSRIEEIKSLLLKYKVVGIWGMGGIGKTTIAKTLFSRISTQFEGCCFIESIREELEKCGGRLVHLQQTIISRVLGQKDIVIDASNVIHQLTKHRFQSKKVLIVLDDVNDYRQLQHLIGGLEPLGAGSRIIITARDKQVISSYGMNEIYEVQPLDDDEALLLFCKSAFKQNYPPQHFQQLSRTMLAYANGNPLALEVLGASLCGKSKEVWDSAVHSLESIGSTKIYDVLKISYDGLNETEKEIFLDIACFLKGEDKDLAITILEACYKSIQYLFDILVDKSLIKISTFTLEMHDLLQELGQRIVFQESKNPGKRSRLWDPEDIYRVLKYNEGTDAVESILLDMSRIEEIHLSAKAFVNMTNLRLLKLYWPGVDFGDHVNISKVCLPQGLEYLPNELRYIRWDGYPLKGLPLEFNLEKLVAIEFPYSNIEEIFEENKYAFNFKSICPKLFNDLLVKGIKHWKRLVKIPSPMQCFTNVRYLNMRRCYSLRSFQRNLHFESPIELDLTGCINLTEFPKISGNVKSLYLSWTAIEEVPPTVVSMIGLKRLTLDCCERLKSISTNICKLKSLDWIRASNCSRLESFPEIMEEMKYVTSLDLSFSAIKEMPSSIENLTGLIILKLNDCKTLRTIPSSIGNLLNLDHLSLSDAALNQLPSSFANWKVIRDLNLAACCLTELPEVICCLTCLRLLDLSRNNFASLPTGIKQLSNLSSLYLRECNMLVSIPELPQRLRYLEASDCELLQSLPEPPSNIEKLDQEFKSGWTLHPHAEFGFQNCFNLNENISRRRIRRMATSYRFYHQKENGLTPGFFFILPGTQIPEWFKYRSFGSSTTIKLPRNWREMGLIGLAVATVIKTEDLDDSHVVGGKVTINWSYDNLTGGLSLGNLRICHPLSDHMVMGFVDVRLLNGYPTTVITFDFDFEYSSMVGDYKYVPGHCGVCPLYEEPNMTKSCINNERFTSTCDDLEDAMSEDASTDEDLENTKDSSNSSGNGDDSSNDEEVEQHPKRIRRN